MAKGTISVLKAHRVEALRLQAAPDLCCEQMNLEETGISPSVRSGRRLTFEFGTCSFFSGWSGWIVPLGVAFIATILYYYFTSS